MGQVHSQQEHLYQEVLQDAAPRKCCAEAWGSSAAASKGRLMSRVWWMIIRTDCHQGIPSGGHSGQEAEEMLGLQNGKRWGVGVGSCSAHVAQILPNSDSVAHNPPLGVLLPHPQSNFQGPFSAGLTWRTVRPLRAVSLGLSFSRGQALKSHTA